MEAVGGQSGGRDLGPRSTELAERLVTAIAVGAYSAGERLPPERRLAATLGVRRDTVRHALAHAATLGLVETRRGREGGTFVVAVDRDGVAPEVARRTLEVELPRLADLFDHRCMVEGMIARAAAQRCTDEDAAELQGALVELRRATSMTEARALDRRLHAGVCAAARNPHLTEASVRLTTAVTLGFGAEPYGPELFGAALSQHEKIVGHVVRGEADDACREATAHVSLTLETMQAGLRRAASRRSASS